MDPLKKKLYYQWFLLIRRYWKKSKIWFFRNYLKKTNNVIEQNQNNIHFLELRANTYNNFYLALESKFCKKNLKIFFYNLKKLLLLYFYLIFFINYKKKDQDVLKLNTYFKVSWSFFDRLDENIFKNEIFKKPLYKNIKFLNVLKILKHILLLYFYIIFLWVEYFFIINNKYIYIYEYNLYLYWGFENRYFFFKLYKLGLIKNYFYNFYKNNKSMPLSNLKKINIKKNIVNFINIYKIKLKSLFLKKYEKRFFYISYSKIIIHKIYKKIKFYKFYYFSYKRWKWYFYLKYQKFVKFYSFLFIYLMDKKIIIHLNFIFNYYYFFFYNINFYKNFIYYKILNKLYIIKKKILKIYKKI